MTRHCTKRNTFILKCFLQFACTNLNGSQKEGGSFLNSLQKEGGTPKAGGVPSEKGGGSNPGGNYASAGSLKRYFENTETITLSYFNILLGLKPIDSYDKNLSTNGWARGQS